MNSSRWLWILLGVATANVGLKSTDACAQELLWKQLGTNAGDDFGRPVAFAGDADGDGFSDVLSTALSSTCNGPPYTGLVSVLLGSDGSEYNTACGLLPSLFGYEIDGRIDIDQDGLADFIIGASSDDRNGNGAGAFIIYSGATGGLLREVLGSSGGEKLGNDVASIADIDADGARDYVVSATPSTAGTEFATVYSGLTGSVLLTLLPAAGSNSFGNAVADAGDVNADGLTDVIVGDLIGDGVFISGSGRVRVFSGVDGSVLHDLDGEHTGSDFGWAVDGVGDVNLDGFADFIIGSPDYIDSFDPIGKIYVYSGQDGTLLFSAIGDDPVLGSGALGYSVSGAGDVNHDGYPDYLAGDPFDWNLLGTTGAVELYSGRNGLRLYHWEGTESANTIGFSVDGGSDVDGDGRSDVVIGMFEDDTNGKDAGAVAVYSLKDFYVDATPKSQYDGGNHTVSLQMAQTAPGNLIALAFTALDGTPTFAFLAIGAADSLGSLTLSGKVPTGLGGHDVDFQAYAIGFNGKLVVSNVEHVEFL